MVDVFEPFESADSFGVTRICWDATLLEGVLTHLWDGGIQLFSPRSADAIGLWSGSAGMLFVGGEALIPMLLSIKVETHRAPA